MAVNLAKPSQLTPIRGIEIGTTQAIKSRRRDDLTVITLPKNSVVAGVFTQNRFAAAPVQVCRTHLNNGIGQNIRALVINAGIANAGTAGKGLKDAKECCRSLGKLLGHTSKSILPFSTGVIMELLPMEQYISGLSRCLEKLSHDNWLAAANAIMTTDTVCKGVSSTLHGKTITGIAKGSGMIAPNMATMLAYIATDAAITPTTLQRWQKEIVRDSFNAISVDGDTSTNDSFILIATGQSGGAATVGEERTIKKQLTDHSIFLAEAIIRDGEGASKLITLDIRGGKTRDLCRKVATSIANSPLVKTALAASDANIGRLLMAIGNASGQITPDTVNCSIAATPPIPLVKNGSIHPNYDEKSATQALLKDEITLHISIGNGKHQIQFKTCDLTHKYIEINASYRS